jgi:hypothetical protein
MEELDIGPFSYHAYLAICAADEQQGEKLRKALESKSIICSTRYDADVSVKSTIKEGITRSRKIIVYVTDNYVRDEWSSFESKKISQKVNRFSRDMVIVLKDERLEHIPDGLRELKEFTLTPVTEAKLSDASFLKDLVAGINKGMLISFQLLLTPSGKFLEAEALHVMTLVMNKT